MGAGPRCSCDLLIELAQRSPCRELLGERADAITLRTAREGLHSELAAEPADWHLRLAQRGATSSDLEQLLAIVRSAESHGYQLLERLGVCAASLRRDIVADLRERSTTGLSRSPERPRRTPRASTGGEPGRSSRTWRSVRERVGRGAERAEAEPAEELDPIDDELGAEPEREPSSEGPARRGNALHEHEGAGHRAHARHEPEASHHGASETESQHRHALSIPERDPAPRRATTADHHELRSVDRRTLPPLHGREEVLAQLADAMLRKSPRPPVMVGPPGSGRSLVARHLARVLDAPVFVLDATAYDDEDGLAQDLDAIAETGGVAVLDDLDRVPSDAVPPFFAALARAWSRRRPPVLTIAAPESHARLDLWLPGGAGSVDRIELRPLPRGELADVVSAAAPTVLQAHGLELAPGTKLGELVRLAERYLTGLAMPGRALDLLDLSCARVARRGGSEVGRETWIDIAAERSGLPRARIEAQGDQLLLELERRLAARVVGHEHVTSTLAQLIRRNRAGFGSHRPVLSTLLLGPSGVGKTEIAKALGEALYERGDALVRLDMSEYAESHAVARVVGAPPGYVGHEQGGALTDPLRQRPHCVVLLDEIEKAHRDVHQLLLQVLDEGRLTDGRGRTVELHHAVIVMTSNLGSDLVLPEDPTMLDEPAVLAAARRAFPVELWNRIEAPLVLQPLGADQMLKICRRLARDSSERLFRERGIRYALSDDACAHLVELAGRDPALGARPLRHLLTREVESLVADAVLRGRLRAGTQAEVQLHSGRIALA
ncbi:MAG: ATP-dependent Clp protease ATP-binding subunit [Myxococcales bacterium]|nr:ATP-dependent Clp protease ATP-binding subunit [Myxococcales bacterium]MCB9713575.1 ATP-dependent Clp protease ATP-binding subunit [Myxococcales bacterium]